MDLIKDHNARGLSYELGVNEFADLSFEEFKQGFLSEDIPNVDFAQEGEAPDGDDIDWRTKKVLTPVKNQGACGSCWAFSTTGSLEAALALKNKSSPPSLSEQELVDCSKSYGNMGCSGGLMKSAFKYIKDHKIGTEKDYPYQAKTLQCRRKEQGKRTGVTGFKPISPMNVQGLATAIEKQPVSVALEVTFSFQLYKRGIYVGTAGCGRRLNHGVLAVGLMKEDENNKYFIVKNSWGTGWGEQGFIRMRTGKGSGNCGIANFMDGTPVI